MFHGSGRHGRLTSGVNYVESRQGSLKIEDFELLKVVGKGSFGRVMQVMKRDTGRIYAVNEAGQLLTYADDGIPGNVANPFVVGADGWNKFKFVFAGQNLLHQNRIYAVNQAGQLLSYNNEGSVTNVANPVTVGADGWDKFTAVFACSDTSPSPRIYAVNENGELLSYGDDGTQGNVGHPTIVGQGFEFQPSNGPPFAGVNSLGQCRIYCMAGEGQLFSYAPSNPVSDLVIVGAHGWVDTPGFSFAGNNVIGQNRIYFVPGGLN